MIEYKLKDVNNNTFSLNGDAVPFVLKGAMTQSGDDFSFDNKIVDRSFLPGSKKIGESRLESRRIVLDIPDMSSDLATYRDNINQLVSFFSKTVRIEDSTNTMDILVVPQSCDIDYLRGSLKQYSDNSMSFEALNPFWEDLVEDSLTGSAIANTIKSVNFNNEGYLDTYPVITLVASVATTNITINILSSNLGIQIQDSLFGTGANLTMVIDCGEGNITMNYLNRNVSIVAGTGFFPLPVGSDTINILSNQNITYTIEWKKRYFV